MSCDLVAVVMWKESFRERRGRGGRGEGEEGDWEGGMEEERVRGSEKDRERVNIIR